MVGKPIERIRKVNGRLMKMNSVDDEQDETTQIDMEERQEIKKPWWKFW
jgi:hypothetical protein